MHWLAGDHRMAVRPVAGVPLAVIAGTADSWLNSAEWGQLRGKGPHYPLAFNAQRQPKPMVQGILDALGKR
jgi:hypothetical protein